MNIGFDAKRYFHNNTGLGNYSRSLVNGLAAQFPEHRYLLFNPKKSKRFSFPPVSAIEEVKPEGFFWKKFPSLWRGKGLVSDLRRLDIQLYHGLSHELPVGIQKSGVLSVVTVHDLIFERYPAQYGAYEVQVHRRKIKYACRIANGVIAASLQTKNDLENFYGIPPEKITVGYQHCDPVFAEPVPSEIKLKLQKAYGLPDRFFLYVGSITERKNLLRICAGMKMLDKELTTPLVVVGSGGAYAESVDSFLLGAQMEGLVIFLNKKKPADENFALKQSRNLAALYQMATALIYPSLFEGFGIPVLEALWSGTPVITSKTSSLPEVGGDAALYIDPERTEDIAAAMLRMQNEAVLRAELIRKGRVQAERFSPEKCVGKIMAVYQQILEHGEL